MEKEDDDRDWVYIGTVQSDPGPGMSDIWDVSICQSGDEYLVRTGGEPYEIGDLHEAAEWISCGSGLDEAEAAEFLGGRQEYEALAAILTGQSPPKRANSGEPWDDPDRETR